MNTINYNNDHNVKYTRSNIHHTEVKMDDNSDANDNASLWCTTHYDKIPTNDMHNALR